MISKDYVSLHPEYGGSAKGFRCEVLIVCEGEEPEPCNWKYCGRVTRTEFGMKTHLRVKHGIRIQGDLFDGDQSRNEQSGVSEGVRGGVAGEKAR